MSSIPQAVLPISIAPRTVPVRQYTRRQASDLVLLLQDRNETLVGFAIRQNEQTQVITLAIATIDTIYTISHSPEQRKEVFTRDDDFIKFLDGRSTTTLVGFSMGRLALSVNRDLGLHIKGLDLSTIYSNSTNPNLTMTEIVSGSFGQSANRKECNFLWRNLCGEWDDKNVGMRAWLAAKVANTLRNRFANVPKVMTASRFNNTELTFLHKIATQLDYLDFVKPREIVNDFDKSASGIGKDGRFRLINTRYRNRVRRSDQTQVIFTDISGKEYVGNARNAQGRSTSIRLEDKSMVADRVVKVTVVGMHESTLPEKGRDAYILDVMHGLRPLRKSDLIRQLWFSSAIPEINWEIGYSEHFDDKFTPEIFEFGHLNVSQEIAAERMLSNQSVVVVHGPPGRGKTTTIAAAASEWDLANMSVWICAHSNVAVKNLAEALFKRGVPFKIIVSKDFYVEWHEHLYAVIELFLLRTDVLGDMEEKDLRKSMAGVNVIVSTLSFLSNPLLTGTILLDLVPLERLVLDEASQINVVEYLHIFGNNPKLQKVCFFGDPLQLPPYGKDRVPELESIFDFDHVMDVALLLDTQYRLPTPLGNFISRLVYKNRLKTEHSIDDSNSVVFVDVRDGEEEKSGLSWVNKAEAKAIFNLVENYYYKSESFCIITPYDAQRSLIERSLQGANLPWESVFNVDSFQGNEADYVLISMVRTVHPGFLQLKQRMNVMLTRCRKGMVIVSQEAFLRPGGGGGGTLVGALAREWSYEHKSSWVSSLSVMQGTASLPGYIGNIRSRMGRGGTIISVNYDYEYDEDAKMFKRVAITRISEMFQDSTTIPSYTNWAKLSLASPTSPILPRTPLAPKPRAEDWGAGDWGEPDFSQSDWGMPPPPVSLWSKGPEPTASSSFSRTRSYSAASSAQQSTMPPRAPSSAALPSPTQSSPYFPSLSPVSPSNPWAQPSESTTSPSNQSAWPSLPRATFVRIVPSQPKPHSPVKKKEPQPRVAAVAPPTPLAPLAPPVKASEWASRVSAPPPPLPSLSELIEGISLQRPGVFRLDKGKLTRQK